MTTLEDPCAPSVRVGARRSDVQLVLEQLGAIEAWTRAHAAAAHVPAGLSREDRLDLARRGDAVARQRQAMLDRTAAQLRDSGDLLRPAATTRAVLAHRNAWFRTAVATGLRDAGVDVVADLVNGADAVGVVVAEQPDVLLVEDRLPMVCGLELCRAVATWAPRTLLAVQVADEWQIGPLLDAGATTVFTRRTPPADVAGALATALAG